MVFAVLQGAELVFPAIGVGPRAFNTLVLVSLLGFPLAVALAWTFDVTGEGIRRTESLPGGGRPGPADRWVRVKAALVGAGFVVVVWLGARLWQPLGTPDGTPVPMAEPTLAVLPLQDLSPGGDQAYLADGLHEEILHQLSRLSGIRLTSKTSSLAMRAVPADSAAAALGVRYVLEGSVRTVPDSIRLTVQLIDALTDEHIWSQTVTKRSTLEGLFELQQDLATNVASSLRGTLVTESDLAFGEPPTESLEAYNEFLRGVYLTNQFDIEAWWQAVDHFERALQFDPEFGRVHAWMAGILGYLNNYGGVTQGELFPRMREHAEAALRYAPDEPRSQLAQLAWVWPQEWNWEEARRIIEYALELDPHHVDALWYLAEWHGVIAGNTERGLEFIQEALRLDPFSPRVLTVQAWVLMNGRRFDEAAAAMQIVVDMDPSNLTAAKSLATNLALSGRQDEALEVLDGILPYEPQPYAPTLAAHLARAGDTDTAWKVLRAAVARKESGGSVSASGIAVGYAALGQVDEALLWLERSFEQEGGVYFLRSPDFDILAPEPRFQALWDRVGLYGRHPVLDDLEETSTGGR